MVSESDINNLTNWTASQMLRTVKHAIIVVLAGGQARLINGRSVTSADLAQLRALKKELESEVAAASGDDGLVYADTKELS